MSPARLREAYPTATATATSTAKKTIGLDWQNNNSARASCTFLCHRCRTTSWNYLISRFVDDVNRRQRLYFSFPQLRYSPLEFNSRKSRQHLTNLTRWNKRDNVSSSVDSFFKWPFRSLRRRCCLSSLFLTTEAFAVCAPTFWKTFSFWNIWNSVKLKTFSKSHSLWSASWS